MEATPITVELVGPEPGQRGFTVQPRRWVIERTFGWTTRCRRLARDHEVTVSSAVAFFVLAAAAVLLRRLARVPQAGSGAAAGVRPRREGAAEAAAGQLPPGVT